MNILYHTRYYYIEHTFIASKDRKSVCCSLTLYRRDRSILSAYCIVIEETLLLASTMLSIGQVGDSAIIGLQYRHDQNEGLLNS